MKLFFLLLLAALPLAAADVFVTSDSGAVPARKIDFSVVATVTAPLVVGGLGDGPGETWAGKVVLLDRGGISFLAKVQAVQAAGGLAVIIANNAPGQDAATLGEGHGTTIPAVSVLQVDGAALKLLAGQTVRVGNAAPVNPLPVATGLPDPKGHKGEYLVSDGTAYVLVKLAPIPVVGLATDVDTGKPVTLSVTADGHPAPTFQWRKNGADIANATGNTFSIAAVALSDTGVYSVLATNEVGAVPSNTVVITVK